MFLIAVGQAVRHHNLTPVVRGLRFGHRWTRPPRDPLWEHPGWGSTPSLPDRSTPWLRVEPQLVRWINTLAGRRPLACPMDQHPGRGPMLAWRIRCFVAFGLRASLGRFDLRNFLAVPGAPESSSPASGFTSCTLRRASGIGLRGASSRR